MRAALALLALALAAAAVVALSASGTEPSGADATGVGQVRAGSVASLAQCDDWNEGTDEQRWATIDDIDAAVNQAGADGPTPDLPAADAYALFQRSCKPTYAAGFRLYKLYARGGAFQSLVP